jgi:hypothetical protein
MASNSKNANLLEESALWKHPLTKEKQRESLQKLGFFTGMSRKFDANSVRDFFKSNCSTNRLKLVLKIFLAKRETIK